MKSINKKIGFYSTLLGLLLLTVGCSGSSSKESVKESSSSSAETEKSSSSSSSTEVSSSSEESASSSIQEIIEETETESDSDEIAAAIKKVDEKYDEMIAKAQGYVDNPSTYNDSASFAFLADYTELMTEYAKLGEAIDASGEDLSTSDALTIYNSLLTKSLKLTELYSELGQ